MTYITYCGWVYGDFPDIERLRAFGFTGEMIPKPDAGIIQYVNASPEVMARACRELQPFNCMSFTAVDKKGHQLPPQQQSYWFHVWHKRPQPTSL